MSFARNAFVLVWLVLGMAALGRGGQTTPPTWLPESSQFARSRLLMEPSMQLPPNCGPISLDAQFQAALGQNAGAVAVYGAFTTRQHSLFLNPSPKDLLSDLRQRVSDSNMPAAERITFLVLSDPTNMGCEISVYAVADGKSLREMPPVAISAPSNEVTMVLLQVAQRARNSSVQQLREDNQFGEDLRNGFIVFVISGVVLVGAAIFLTDYSGRRQINQTNAHAKAVFERHRVAWQERISNLALKYSQLNEFLPFIDNSPAGEEYLSWVRLVGDFAEAGARRVEEITTEANQSGQTKADYERLTAQLDDGFVLQLVRPWYEGSPFEPDQKEIKLTLGLYEQYATEVFQCASAAYKQLNGITPASNHGLLPPS